MEPRYLHAYRACLAEDGATLPESEFGAYIESLHDDDLHELLLHALTGTGTAVRQVIAPPLGERIARHAAVRMARLSVRALRKLAMVLGHIIDHAQSGADSVASTELADRALHFATGLRSGLGPGQLERMLLTDSLPTQIRVRAAVALLSSGGPVDPSVWRRVDIAAVPELALTTVSALAKCDPKEALEALCRTQPREGLDWTFVTPAHTAMLHLIDAGLDIEWLTGVRNGAPEWAASVLGEVCDELGVALAPPVGGIGEARAPAAAATKVVGRASTTDIADSAGPGVSDTRTAEAWDVQNPSLKDEILAVLADVRDSVSVLYTTHLSESDGDGVGSVGPTGDADTEPTSSTIQNEHFVSLRNHDPWIKAESPGQVGYRNGL